MSAKTILSAFILLASSSLSAQQQVTGAFVSTLGTDTSSIERYTRTRDRLEGDILARYPRVRIIHYVADLDGARFKGMSLVTRRVTTDAASTPMFSMVTLIGDTAATVEVQRAGKPDSVNSGRRTFRGGRVAPVVPSAPSLPSYAVYEQMLAAGQPIGKDTIVVTLISSNAGPNNTISITRHGKDSVYFNNSFFPGWIERGSIDAAGRLTGVDATATTVKTLTRRVSDIDFDGIAKSWAALEAVKGPAGQMSPADTARALIGGANIEVAYSRPTKRGRVVFGNIVPWNQVWRTGANAATQLTTSADLIVGSTLVPAGKYTLWSIPTPTGAKLVINSQTGQWGTDYDMSKDFARLDLNQTILTKPVEQFTFTIVPQGNLGILKFAWDDREYWVPFRVK